MTVVKSKSAIARVAVPVSAVKDDVLLKVILGVCSPLQVSVEVGGKRLEMQSNEDAVLCQRNAILLALCGSTLHFALSLAPHHLLGGNSLGGISSWMTLADSIRHSKNNSSSVEETIHYLNSHLANQAFVLEKACKATIADLDLSLALLPHYLQHQYQCSHVLRWMDQCLATVLDLATNHRSSNKALPPIDGLNDKFKNIIPAPPLVPLFFYGDMQQQPTDSRLVKPNVETSKESKGDVSSTQTTSQQPAKKTSSLGTNTREENNNNKKKQEKKPVSTPKNAVQEGQAVNVSALEIRVGKISKVWEHPAAEKLYCEEIDMGGGSTRNIASGLRPFYSLEEMQHQTFLVLCNLKPRTLLGFTSHGMVLCASNDAHDKVQFVQPPSNSIIGERVQFGDLVGEPEAENKVAKKKLFELLSTDLKTNGEGILVWKEHKGMTSAGPCISSLCNARVS